MIPARACLFFLGNSESEYTNLKFKMAGEMGEDEDSFYGIFNASLKQFIGSLEPTLKDAGSLTAAEDILTHLEATDENFHRYVGSLFNFFARFSCISVLNICAVRIAFHVLK